MTTKTERFREIAKKHNNSWEDDDAFVWFDTAIGKVTVGDHVIEIIESTNFNAESTYAGPDLQNEWIIVRFEDELYRRKGIYNSWDSTEWEDWQRIEERPVTQYVEVDNESE